MPLLAQAQCRLERVRIEPLAADRQDVYIGATPAIEVRFHNEKRRGAVDTFPEPPLTIKHLDSGTQCEIDGGIWLRNAVYVSGDGKTLMTQQYSGSNDQLLFHDTRSCRQTGMIDVSDAHWKVSNSRIEIDYPATKRKKSFRLNHSCLPMSEKNKGGSHGQS